MGRNSIPSLAIDKACGLNGLKLQENTAHSTILQTFSIGYGLKLKHHALQSQN